LAVDEDELSSSCFGRLNSRELKYRAGVGVMSYPAHSQLPIV